MVVCDSIDVYDIGLDLNECWNWERIACLYNLPLVKLENRSEILTEESLKKSISISSQYFQDSNGNYINKLPQKTVVEENVLIFPSSKQSYSGRKTWEWSFYGSVIVARRSSISIWRKCYWGDNLVHPYSEWKRTQLSLRFMQTGFLWRCLKCQISFLSRNPHLGLYNLVFICYFFGSSLGYIWRKLNINPLNYHSTWSRDLHDHISSHMATWLLWITARLKVFHHVRYRAPPLDGLHALHVYTHLVVPPQPYSTGHVKQTALLMFESYIYCFFIKT